VVRPPETSLFAIFIVREHGRANIRHMRPTNDQCPEFRLHHRRVTATLGVPFGGRKPGNDSMRTALALALAALVAPDPT
jgi:hypothetical protein